MSINLKKKPKLPLVMGLDVSTHTGVVVLNSLGYQVMSDEINLTSLPNTATMPQRTERCIHLHDRVTKELLAYKPEIVAVEGYSYGHVQSQVTMVELGAAVRMALYAYAKACSPVLLLEVSPPSLKKFVLGKGVGPKEQVMLQVFKRWGFEPDTNNVADAYVLARIAGAFLIPNMEPLTKPMAEVVKNLSENH